MDARRAQGVQTGPHSWQINNFNFGSPTTPPSGSVTDQDANEDPRKPTEPRPTWLLALTTLGRGLLWLLKALLEVLERATKNRRPSAADEPSSEAMNTPRQRRKPRAKAGDADSTPASDASTPTAPWTPRQRVGVLLWIAIAFVVLWQCQGPAASTTPPDGSVQLSDGFDAGPSPWQVTSAGGAPAPAVTDGTLSVSSASGAVSVASTSKVANFDPTDSIVEAEVVRTEGEGQYGILCRRFVRGGGDNYYKFAVRDDGYVGIFKLREGRATAHTLSHWRPATSLKYGKSNHVVAQCRTIVNGAADGVQLNLWINGERVASVTDYATPLIRGTIALFAEANAGRTLLAAFDRLTIKRPSAGGKK